MITVHFSKVKPQLETFQFVPTTWGFQVALNLGETAPLKDFAIIHACTCAQNCRS